MTTIDRTRLSIQNTAPRMTPPPASRRFAEALARSGTHVVQGVVHGVLQGAVHAAAFVPGGNLVTAAVREVTGAVAAGLGAAIAGTPGGGSPESPAQLPGGDTGGVGNSAIPGDDLLSRGQEMSMRMLRLQESISEENRRYTALSNVMHARHEMAKNAINNIR